MSSVLDSKMYWGSLFQLHMVDGKYECLYASVFISVICLAEAVVITLGSQPRCSGFEYQVR